MSGLLVFEGYELDRAQWQLRYGEEVLPLNRKTFDLLLYLLEHADRVVTKDELLRVLWPEQFIEESNLTQQVFLLRRALARHSGAGRIVETVPGRGYRIAVPVRFEPRAEEPGPRHSPGKENAAHEAEFSRPGDGMPADGAPRDGASPLGESLQTATPLPQGAANRQAAPVVTRSLRESPLLWSAGFAVLALLIAYGLLRPRASARFGVSTYKQITHDGHAKALGGTDGSRIYFTRLEKSAIAQISLSGKAEALLQLALQDPWSGTVSPDGSTLLIISQAGGQGPAASLWALQLVNGSLHRLGNAISSAWSPDGRQIVYASASGELFVMRSDGSDAHRIASVGGNISSIAWSPDGHLIRFSRDGLLWDVSPSGSNLAQVFPGWGKSPTQWGGEWSPAGTYFFVADGQIWMLDESRGPVWKREPVPTQLTYGPLVWDHPISSRDGTMLLASGRTRRGELVRFDPGSIHPSTILGGMSAEFVTFSQAAHAVAYVTYPDGVLWRANMDGSNAVQLTEPDVYPKSVCWSPDGRQLAFVDRTADSPSAMFVIAADGTGKARRVLPTESAAETDPSWSPDGRKLVFSTAPNVGASAKADLRIFDLDTAKAVPVPGSDGLLVPRWSPDGHAIAAMTLDSKGLKLLDLATGRWSTLDTGAVAFPEWAHDSQWIYYVRWTTNPALLRIRVADGRQELLADLTGVPYTGVYTLWMGLDLSDRPMMLRDAGTDDIYALTLKRE